MTARRRDRAEVPGRVVAVADHCPVRALVAGDPADLVVRVAPRAPLGVGDRRDVAAPVIAPGGDVVALRGLDEPAARVMGVVRVDQAGALLARDPSLGVDLRDVLPPGRRRLGVGARRRLEDGLAGAAVDRDLIGEPFQAERVPRVGEPYAAGEERLPREPGGRRLGQRVREADRGAEPRVGGVPSGRDDARGIALLGGAVGAFDRQRLDAGAVGLGPHACARRQVLDRERGALALGAGQPYRAGAPAAVRWSVVAPSPVSSSLNSRPSGS